MCLMYSNFYSVTDSALFYTVLLKSKIFQELPRNLLEYINKLTHFLIRPYDYG